MKLFQQFLAGSANAFRDYFDRYHLPVYESLQKMSGDQHTAEDLTQEVFKSLWACRGHLTDEEHLRRYLFFMARRLFLQQLKREKAAVLAEKELSRTMDAAERSADFILVREEVAAALEDAMRKLPPQQKMVTQLLLDGLDTSAVAHRLKLNPQTVRNTKSQAIRALRLELAGRGLSLILWLGILLFCFYHP